MGGQESRQAEVGDEVPCSYALGEVMWLEGDPSAAWLLDARDHGVAGDAMSDDAAPLKALLEQAVDGCGTWLRIPRGIYRVNQDVEVWFPGGGQRFATGVIASEVVGP